MQQFENMIVTNKTVTHAHKYACVYIHTYGREVKPFLMAPTTPQITTIILKLVLVESIH